MWTMYKVCTAGMYSVDHVQGLYSGNVQCGQCIRSVQWWSTVWTMYVQGLYSGGVQCGPCTYKDCTVLESNTS